jgi:hypothetical protein
VINFLEQEDVLALLRKRVGKAGSQLAWSKKTGMCRPNLNNILKERRPLRGVILPTLGLRIAYARNIQTEQSAVQVFRYDEVIDLLREEINNAGGQVAWAKKNGFNRSHLNLMLNRRRPLTDSILPALRLRVVYVRGN